MIKKEQDGIFWKEFELLADFRELKHGVFLRQGGKSCGEFSSLNVSTSVGDCTQSVAQNRERLAACLGCTEWVIPKMTHGNKVLEVAQKNVLSPPVCDGVMTHVPNLGLLVTHADCQAAIFYDPVVRALATVHSGWRGSVANIYAKTVSAMKQTFGSKPENLLVGVSASLCPESAEFIHYEKELPREFWNYQTKKNHFDFWQISRMQLLQSGLLKNHIEIAEESTFFNKEEYFSFRREGVTGRHGTLALICTPESGS